MLYRFLAIIIVTVGAIAAPANANNTALTEDQAKRFVASLSSVETLGRKLEAEGKNDYFKIDNQPKLDAVFTPFTSAVSFLKEKHPAEHGQLASAVKLHGFSPTQWGAAGDRVMIAYLALKMDQESPGALDEMRAFDPAMLEMIPPAMQTQIKFAMAMAQAVADAPAADRAAVKTVQKALDQYMDRQGAQSE